MGEHSMSWLTYFPAFVAAVGAFGGGVGGYYVAQFYTTRREREARVQREKREAYLGVLQAYQTYRETQLRFAPHGNDGPAPVELEIVKESFKHWIFRVQLDGTEAGFEAALELYRATRDEDGTLAAAKHREQARNRFLEEAKRELKAHVQSATLWASEDSGHQRPVGLVS